MTHPFSPRTNRFLNNLPYSVLLFSGLVLLACGCTEQASFSLNAVYLRVYEKPFDTRDERGNITKAFRFDQTHHQDIGTILVGLFGTPDEPRFPQLAQMDTGAVVDMGRLRLAAGPVGRDKDMNPVGLYREHCAHCHGITGDGAGPTAAFLNPYARDYRKGVFKFKSTPAKERPTDSDLKRILHHGIPDTAMPSFKLLSDPELEALVHYVKYLAIRGEVERKLMEILGQELNEKERLIDVDADVETYVMQIGRITDAVTGVVESWHQAEAMVTEVPPRPQIWDEDERERRKAILHGRQLFYGRLECVKCHGDTAIGDGQQTDFDEWVDDWRKPLNVDPNNLTRSLANTSTEKRALILRDRSLIREFVDLGAPLPRNVRPRNLRQGVYRGGRRPVDLYWRVRNGIAGTPMPAQTDTGPSAVSSEDVWSVIEYVRQLPFEPISRPANWQHVQQNVKEIR